MLNSVLEHSRNKELWDGRKMSVNTPRPVEQFICQEEGITIKKGQYFFLLMTLS